MLRDYIKEPLKYIREGSVLRREKPYKDDLYEMFIEKNMSIKEISEYLNYNSRMLQNVLKEYGIKKDRKKVYEVQKKTLLERDGVENAFQLKESIKKAKQTCLEKYGKEHYSQTDEFKEKNNNTRIERYGDDPYQREKYKKTCREKYGVDNTNYTHYTDEQQRFLADKAFTEQFIEENKISSAIEFSNKIGVKQQAGATILCKHGLYDLLKHDTSREEKELQDILISHNINFITHYRMDNRQEIDIYIPTKNIGIEFNGDYWHSDIFKEKLYHQNKSQYALTNYGIFVYHIFEYEWKTRKQQVCSQLFNLLGINQEKIYARKCVIKEVENKEKKQFLEENHMQGNDSSSIKVGLYHNNELVSLMTFVKPRFNTHYEWELSRFCSKVGCNVIGGASKLFNYFINKYRPKSLISYSNNAHTKGKLYEILGFKLSLITEPNYVWFNGQNIITRYQSQKHKLIEQGYVGNSEVEIMRNNGYNKIYDCGNKVWVWNP